MTNMLNERYDKKAKELSAHLKATSREVKPDDSQMAFWQEVVDEESGEICWCPRYLYDEYRKYDMLRRMTTILGKLETARPKLADCRVLATDYSHYGGQIERWVDDNLECPDCSCGCHFFAPLFDQESLDNSDADYGVCLNPASPRYGLLTFEHQAGTGCFEDKS